ncbi:MAG TPA: transposase [Propionibacteriaceae bacterium]
MSRALSPNGRVLRHPGDLEWLERRRLQAAELFAQGKTRAEVAGQLGVSAQTASRWHVRWRAGGVAGMRTARHGKPPRLGPAELARIRRVLDRGPVAAGFDNDLWTLAPRSSSGPPGWRTIPGMSGASSRRYGGACSARPARPSSATRPRSPGGSPRSGHRSRKRPNAQSLAVLRRRVGRQADPPGAPDLGAQGPHAGAAPPLPAWQADLDVRPGGLPARPGRPRRAGSLDGLRPAGGAYDTRQFIRVLDGLGHQLGHQPVTVIWDNLGAHHAGDLQDWAATQPWLELAYLPSYAPELDPVEGLWANLKGCELANRCCADRKELIATAQVGSIRVRRDPELLRSFLAGTGLTL